MLCLSSKQQAAPFSDEFPPDMKTGRPPWRLPAAAVAVFAPSEALVSLTLTDEIGSGPLQHLLLK